MRKVAFVYVIDHRNQEGYYDTRTFGSIIENWVEVDDETYRTLCYYFRNTQFYTQSGDRQLIMLEEEVDLTPKVITEVIELAASYKKQYEEEERKRREKKAARERKKLEKQVKDKQALLEQLKKELGEAP
jgi:predicted RNase H-like nuclease (RuvC/YqgF family)